VTSSTREAAHTASERIRKDRGADVEVALGREDITAAGDLAAHTDALVALLALCLDIAPRPLRVVVRPELGWLHVRGEGVPTMGTGIPAERIADALAVATALGELKAELLLDRGGFAVAYEKAE